MLVTVSEIEQHMNHEFRFLEIISGWKIFLEKHPPLDDFATDNP